MNLIALVKFSIGEFLLTLKRNNFYIIEVNPECASLKLDDLKIDYDKSDLFSISNLTIRQEMGKFMIIDL